MIQSFSPITALRYCVRAVGLALVLPFSVSGQQPARENAATPAEIKMVSFPPLPAELATLRPVALLPAANADFAFYDRTENPTPATFVALPGPGLAYRAESPGRGKYSYDVEAKLKTSAPVKKGDVVLARFLARAPVARQETGEGSLGFAFQRAVAPHEKSIELDVSVGPEWSLFEIPFTVANDFAAGQAVVALSFGNLPQTVEITQLEVHNFSSRARLDQLPKTRFTYLGREADAPWRAAALERIEQIRTAPLSIRVTDAAGQPLVGARVEARLIQPEFIFGSEVDDTLIVADTPDAARYRASIVELFDTVVLGNGLKWPTWSSGSRRQAVARRALDWISEQSLRQKGHNLLWPSWQFSPREQRAIPDLPAALPKLITAHITEMMKVTKGRVYAWDVVNEPLHERDYFDHIPESAMADWFKLARSLDPDVQLFINEYSMLNDALSPGTIARLRALLATLRTAGAPIDGIGIQGHISQQPRAPELVLADLDLIAAEGLPIQITEFDINTRDEALQADYTRDFLIACYSHPAVTGFIMWGFWESRHWKPAGAMIRPDWSEKPNAAVWRDLVLDKWKTRVDATTPVTGSVAARGHLGRYRVTVTHQGVINRQDLTLTRAGADVTVRFP